MKSRSDAFLDEAVKQLGKAKEEMFKPVEDAVSYSICKNAQFAIENYLRGFLVKNNVDIDTKETIESLYQKCLEVDKNFEQIDLDAIGCRHHSIDSRYCTEMSSVSACYDTADTIDTFLRKKKVL